MILQNTLKEILYTRKGKTVKEDTREYIYFVRGIDVQMGARNKFT